MERISLQEVDISRDNNRRWRNLYKYDIPVLFLEGKYVCKHRLDYKLLSRYLEEIEQEWRRDNYCT